MSDYIKTIVSEAISDFKESIINKDVMSIYYGINSNGHSPQKLNEVTVDRVLNKHGKNGMIIISANRSDLDNETNNANTRELIKDIRSTPFSYFPVYGGYHGTDDVVDSYEPSFVVTNYSKQGEIGDEEDFQKLFDFAIEMCGKYNQDSVLVKAPNDVPHYYNRNGEMQDSKSTDKVIKNDPNQEFFTSMIKTNKLDREHPERSKRFTYDISFDECYCNPNPCTLNEKMRRRKCGEILIS